MVLFLLLGFDCGSCCGRKQFFPVQCIISIGSGLAFGSFNNKFMKEERSVGSQSEQHECLNFAVLESYCNFSEHYQLCNKFLINSASSGLQWKNRSNWS